MIHVLQFKTSFSHNYDVMHVRVCIFMPYTYLLKCLVQKFGLANTNHSPDLPNLATYVV